MENKLTEKNNGAKFVKIILKNDDKVLQHYFLRAQKWDLPAGIVEEGETEIGAAKRELLERTGYEISETDLTLKGIVTKNDTDYYLFEGAVKNAKQVAQPGEKGGYTTQVRWISNSINPEELKLKIQEYLGKEVIQFTLKGKGAVNYAYYLETEDGKKYIVKQERDDKEFQPQNDLMVEAKVAQKLHGLNLSVPIPNVVFISENPKMYGYEYIEGDLLRAIWEDLSENEKINTCRDLGRFHAEIGKKFTKEMAEAIGITIDMSPYLHPEVSADYDRLILDANVPEDFKVLVKKAKSIFDTTQDKLVFQFLHNDSHHENIIIKDKAISGIIDFGNAEYGEIAKEFSRYIRDFPDHFQHIISAYEEVSGNKLSYERLVSNSMVSGFIDVVENYWKGGEDREKADRAIEKYKELLST